MSEQPTTTCETCGSPVRVVGDTTLHYAPVEPSGLTVEDVQAWAERMADRQNSLATQLGILTEKSTGRDKQINDRAWGYAVTRRSVYRELAEALAKGELPHE